MSDEQTIRENMVKITNAIVARMDHEKKCSDDAMRRTEHRQKRQICHDRLNIQDVEDISIIGIVLSFIASIFFFERTFMFVLFCMMVVLFAVLPFITEAMYEDTRYDG